MQHFIDVSIFCYSEDATQTGHFLGSPESRTANTAPERYLSPPAVCIMRAIMHAAMIWCSCHRDDVVHDLVSLVKPFVYPKHLPEFFWMHLCKDIEHLSHVTGKSMEDSTIMVHLALSEILLNKAPVGKIPYQNNYHDFISILYFSKFCCRS